jgi:hypothetical protein
MDVYILLQDVKQEERTALTIGLGPSKGLFRKEDTCAKYKCLLVIASGKEYCLQDAHQALEGSGKFTR